MKNKNKQNIKYSKSQLIGSFLSNSLWLFIAGIILSTLASLSEMVNPQIIRYTIDNIVKQSNEGLSGIALSLINAFGGVETLSGKLWLVALAIVVVAIFHVIALYFSRVINTKASETLIKTMRDRLFSKIIKLPFSWHMKNQTGDIIQRCTSDIDTMKMFVSEQLASIFRIIIMLILSLTFMFPMSIKLTLIALAPMPIIMGYSLVFHNHVGKHFQVCDENEGKLSAIAQENLTGVRVVRAFGREKYEKDKFNTQNEYYTGLWKKMGSILSRFWSISDVLSGVQIMLIVVFGAIFCINGDLKSGEYISFISYNSMLVWPIRQLGRMLSEMSKAGVSIERIRYIMNSEIEEDKPNSIEAPLDKDISFNHVNFAYDGCPQILHDINFNIKAGSVLGVLGGTGSGKSTLMYLLDKLYDLSPENGSITIGGVDINDIKTDHLRAGIGIVLQEPFLFSRTISDNIGITKENITLTEIREAAKAACLDETVSNFTNGYDTFVGERGVTLSGGQKQRAAIARILTQNTPIMIFDDSLSAVDTETDSKIRKALESKFGESTIILISHRISTLSKADKIIVLEQGQIIESGTHDELINLGGLYSKINDIQSGGLEEVIGA